jgi:formylglycine-generating enzyme required for sulfatase activity
MGLPRRHGQPFYYGDLDTDFAAFANLADATIRNLAYDARDQYSPDLIPRDDRFNDHKLVSTEVGSFQGNAWGLHDMHGNVWEWTRSAYQPYPVGAHDGRHELTHPGDRVVRGGSWYDRPKRSSSSFRLSYPAWRKVYNVGFRVIMVAAPTARFTQCFVNAEFEGIAQHPMDRCKEDNVALLK